MPAIIETTELISKTMDSLIDFIVNKGTYLINLSTSILIYWYSIHLVNINILTLGELLLVINYIGVLHRKFNWILRIYLDRYSRRISIDRVGELLNTEMAEFGGTWVKPNAPMTAVKKAYKDFPS